MTPHLPITPPTQGMTYGPSAPAMELQGIGGSGARDGPEAPRDTTKTSATLRRQGGNFELQEIGGSRTHDDPEESEEPLDTAKTPATSRRRGGFNYDREWGLYLLAWDDLADFEAWHREEELAYTIEILSSSRYYGRLTSLWMLRHMFVCRCEYPGGKSKYVRKCPDWHQKVPSKKSGCCFRLIIKFYLNTSVILGHIERDHDHETGIPNLIHTHISCGAQARIKIMLRQKIDPREIVCT